MRIVVTGALGHIGSELIRNPTLINACDEIVLIDDLSTHKFGSLFNLPPGVKYTLLQGDVAQELSVTLSESVDAVIHLAGITDPLASVSNPNWLFGLCLSKSPYVGVWVLDGFWVKLRSDLLHWGIQP